MSSLDNVVLIINNISLMTLLLFCTLIILLAKLTNDGKRLKKSHTYIKIKQSDTNRCDVTAHETIIGEGEIEKHFKMYHLLS